MTRTQTRDEAALEWYDTMDEWVIDEWRRNIREGQTCPICNGHHVIKTPAPEPGLPEESERCPLCWELFKTEEL